MSSFDSLIPVRNHFAPIAKELVTFLDKVKTDMKEKETTLLSNINALIESGKSGHDTFEKTEKMSLIGALSEIHQCLSVYQRLSTKIQIDIIPSVSSMFNDAKSTFSMEKTSILNSEQLARNIGTISQRDNETNYILAKATKLMSDIDTVNKSIKSLCVFVEEQISYLNRLDSAIRLKQSIKSSGDYLDGVTGTTPSGDLVDEEAVEAAVGWDVP